MKLDIRVNDLRLIPTRANPTDAGWDLYCRADRTFAPGEKHLVDTGLQIRIPKYFVGLLVPRSSLQKKGLILANSVGIIDADYRGNIFAALKNIGDKTVTIEANERFVQLLIVPVVLAEANVVIETDDVWNDTSRGVGGFGSTG
jgi:dUTP pyrophosphatase